MASTSSHGHNRLTRAEERKVEDWYVASRDRIASRKWLVEEAAKVAAKELGFTVTRHNLAGAAKTMGQKWPHVSGTRVGTGQARAEQIRQLEQRVTNITRYLHTLAHKLGEKVPDELTYSEAE